MSKEKERIEKEWLNYRNQVYENKSKSQDHFEKYINLLASGAIILSLAFLEKIITVDKTTLKPIYLISLLSLVITLLSNLYSHYKSTRNCDITIKEIDDEAYNEISENIVKRNKSIDFLNAVSIGSLILGIVLILIFVSFNLFNLNNQQNTRPAQPSKPTTEEKGVTPTPPQISNLNINSKK